MKILDSRLMLPPEPPDLEMKLTLDLDLSSSISISQISPLKSSVPAVIPSTAAPSYAERFKASLRNLRKISSTVLLEDGAPVVQAQPQCC